MKHINRLTITVTALLLTTGIGWAELTQSEKILLDEYRAKGLLTDSNFPTLRDRFRREASYKREDALVRAMEGSLDARIRRDFQDLTGFFHQYFPLVMIGAMILWLIACIAKPWFVERSPYWFRVSLIACILCAPVLCCVWMTEYIHTEHPLLMFIVFFIGYPIACIAFGIAIWIAKKVARVIVTCTQGIDQWLSNGIDKNPNL